MSNLLESVIGEQVEFTSEVRHLFEHRAFCEITRVSLLYIQGLFSILSEIFINLLSLSLRTLAKKKTDYFLLPNVYRSLIKMLEDVGGDDKGKLSALFGFEGRETDKLMHSQTNIIASLIKR